MEMKRLLLSAALIVVLQGNAAAGPGNIAGNARVTVSSELDARYTASNLTDGLIGIKDQGEWACQGQVTSWGALSFPWVQLDWDSEQHIDRILLYDRPAYEEHTAGGTLEFSDGSKLSVTAIPNDGTAKVVTFPSKKVSWVRFVVTDGHGKDLGLSEIEVYPSPEAYPDYLSWVDPYIETTRGRYFFFVTGSRPFGMISAAPITRNKNQGGGGYNYNSLEILGFGQIHCWMLSGLEIMPVTGRIDPRGGQQAWKSAFSHDDEIVQPGYQRVFLRDHQTWVEQTATDRVSFYRFRYTEDAQASVLTNLGGYLGSVTMENAEVRQVSSTEIEGSFHTTGRFWGGPEDTRIFFVIRFNRPFDQLDGWQGETLLTDINSVRGDSAGVAARYRVKAGDTLLMKLAVSYTTLENARKNLESECTHWDFDRVRMEAAREWNQWLGRIDVKGGSTAQRIKFYTDLWHVLLGRHKINDASGDYPDYTQGERKGTFTDAQLKIRTLPKDANGKVRFNMYNSDAFWLTQWNLNILWGLAWPELLDEFSASLIQYADNGGLLPRGPSAGGYSYIMTGCPATNLIVSAYMKGLLRKADPLHAFETMKRNHLPGGMMGVGAEDALDHYIRKGWAPGNAGLTLEWSFQDWALAQMAGKLGKKRDYRYFQKRSEGWKNCYHPGEKLLFPRLENGEWLHTDPLLGQGWIEANAWQATWGVSHDIAGLADRMGGNDVLTDKLNHAFEQSKEEDFVYGYSNGYVSYANQPGCSNAHVFSHAGKPWLTQYWVRRVQEQAYGGITPDKGYGGHDEDQGQMGGVSALMSIGLFSITGNTSATPVYEITSPVFDEIRIQLDPNYYTGKEFIIKTLNNTPENDYIQRASLNGQPQKRFWFPHAAFAKGGTLEIELGPEPNRQWGLDQEEN